MIGKNFHRNHSARITQQLLLAGLGALAGLVAAYYLLLTSDAAQWVTRAALYRYLGLQHIAINRINGNVLSGFTAYDVRIPDLIKQYPASTLDIAQAHIAPILSWKIQGPVFDGSHLRLSAGPLADEITAESAEGSVFGGIRFRDLHFHAVHDLPAKSEIDVQQLESGWPVGWRKLRVVQNGRLRLAQSEPIVFFGSRANEQVEAGVFSKTLDIHEVLGPFVKSSSILKECHGIVNNLNLTVNNQGPQWIFKGTFEIASLTYKEVSLMNNAGRVDWQLQNAQHLTGEMVYWGGTLTAKQVVLTVRPSTLTFTGDLFSPVLDLNGNASVGTTKIQVALKGTKQEPQLVLNSEPPLSQETLLLMLVTGKTWRGAREALAQGAISSELATDFIDYVFFGGLGNRMARRFGITDIAITQDVENNLVGAQTTFADRMTLDVEVDPTKRSNTAGTTEQPAGSKQSLPLRVGAEYQVTDRTAVRLEGERSPVEQKSPSQESLSGTEKSAPEVDNTILLKVKRRF